MADARFPALAPEAFVRPTPLGPDTVYLCGHSLGAQPQAAGTAVQQVLEQWATRGVDAWFDGPEAWAERQTRLRALLGQVVGADPTHVAVLNSLTTLVHTLLLRFAAPRGERRIILHEAGLFPSDRFALHSVARLLGLDPARDLVELGPEPGQSSLDEDRIEAEIARLGERLNLFYWSGVDYRSGQAFDLPRLTRAAQRQGAWAVWDLAHAAGNRVLDLDRSGADAACWCHYKYLNGGPGALGGLYLAPAHQTDGPPLAGWWGHQPQARFGAGEAFVPRAGAVGWETSTPNLLSQAAIEAALTIAAEVGIATIAQRGQALCAQAAEQLRARGERVLTPRDRHGAMLSVDLGDSAQARFSALCGSGILGDLRPPGILRVAFASLYNGSADLDQLLLALERR